MRRYPDCAEESVSIQTYFRPETHCSDENQLGMPAGSELLLRDERYAKHLARVDGNPGIYIFVLKPYGSSHEFTWDLNHSKNTIFVQKFKARVRIPS